ncbi:MAG: RsmB/NOP family class I SAM-dependent RNA methyltransferase [Candidatus Aenigmatarchaeota archaeon]
MIIPRRLSERLKILGISEGIYNRRAKKCLLSRERLNLDSVPWCENAYFVNEGYADYLVFDPVSLVPCIALEPKKSDRVLDMCAAPGTKTFILSFLTDNKAEITANDIDKNRIRRLAANAEKYKMNCEILNLSGRKIEGSFNKILLDAPCSGEGMINKSEKVFRHWSEKRIKFLTKKQKKLINHAFEILESGGILVYSTCTFAPEENEAVIDFLLERWSNAKIENVNVKNIVHANGLTSWNNVEFHSDVEKCIRIYPEHNGTGGFFVAKIRKK